MNKFDEKYQKLLEAKKNKSPKSKSNNDVIEKLADLEHKQWMSWAKNILSSEDINKERAKRWKQLFVPYKNLTEEMKELDREWARKALKIINKE